MSTFQTAPLKCHAKGISSIQGQAYGIQACIRLVGPEQSIQEACMQALVGTIERDLQPMTVKQDTWHASMFTDL